MKKKIIYIVMIVFATVWLFKISGNAQADTSYCDDDPATPNWGYCYYFPDSQSWLCLKGPAKTCDGVHIE